MASGSRFKSGASAGVADIQAQLSRRAPADGSNLPPNVRPILQRPPSRYREVSPERDDADEDTPLLKSTPAQPARGISFAEDVVQHRKPARRKLGTLNGVLLPCVLNIVGIILFLRFGFLLGQAGLLGTIGMLALAYAINVLTATSVSAIATNGRVHGGGAYYLTSRTLGVESGGAVGIVFLTCQALNADLNILGAVEVAVDIFGVSKSTGPIGWAVLPEGRTWQFLYASILLACCTAVVLAGSKLFARAQNLVLAVMAVSILSIPLSLAFQSPFFVDSPTRPINYTGPRLSTLRENLLPGFTSDAKGSALPPGVKENWSSVFGVVFPAVAGMLAGLSMSADLRKPSRSIPKGTFYALMVTAIVYGIVLLSMASSVTRNTLHEDLGVLQDISAAPFLVILGILSSTVFSALLGLLSCAKILQAVARDHLLPPLDIFGQGREGSDDPTNAVLVTWAFAQLSLLLDNVNMVSTLVTQCTLLVFGSINLACFALRASSAPNFRPSFRLFNEWTALAGVVVCFGAMLFNDVTVAGFALFLLCALLVVIHYVAPSKSYGDVGQALIFHQVRKYLLRLDERKAHIKFWRPQILLLTANPRHDWPAIIFANNLKKSGLLILGHVLKGSFSDRLEDLRRQHAAWLKLVDVAHVKAFVDMTIAPDEREGARQCLLNAGLGSMRPNLVMLGFPDRFQAREANASSPSVGDKSDVTIHAVSASADQIIDMIGELPTDSERQEESISATAFVGIVEDIVSLNKAVAICYGFSRLRLPTKASSKSSTAPIIDLWPLLSSDSGWATYTLILLLGTTLASVPAWKRHRVRVNTFVESPAAIAEEKQKIALLLSSLRIRAELRVFALATGQLSTYETIVHGVESKADAHVNQSLAGDPWYDSLRALRRHARQQRPTSSRPTSPTPRDESKTSSRTSSVDGSKLQRLTAALAKGSEAINLRIGAPVRHPAVRMRRARTLDTADAVSDDSSDSSSSSDEEDIFRKRPQPRRSSLSRLPDEPTLSAVHRRYGSASAAVRPTLSLVEPTSDLIPEEPSLPPMPSSPRSGRRVRRDDDLRRSVELTLPQFTFDDLPLRAQLVILNELMSTSVDETEIIFTSLPPPAAHSSDSYETSSSYLSDLRCLLAGLPPAIAFSSTELVATTAL